LADGADCDGADCDGADCDGADCDGVDCDGADCDGADCDGADWTVTDVPSRLSDAEGSSSPGVIPNSSIANSTNSSMCCGAFTDARSAKSSSCCGTSTDAGFPLKPGSTLDVCMHASGTAELVHSSDPD